MCQVTNLPLRLVTLKCLKLNIECGAGGGKGGVVEQPFYVKWLTHTTPHVKRKLKK